MTPEFHLSIGVRSLEESVAFFESVLQAKVSHRDSAGAYVNVELYGSEITLKPNPKAQPDVPDLHFGVNLGLAEFDRLAGAILASGYPV